MDKKERPIHMLSIIDPTENERYTWTKSKGMEKDISSNENEKKKAGVELLISDKINLKQNL